MMELLMRSLSVIYNKSAINIKTRFQEILISLRHFIKEDFMTVQKNYKKTYQKIPRQIITQIFSIFVEKWACQI